MLSLMLATCLSALSVAWTLPAEPSSLEIEKGDVAITVSSAQGPLVQYRFADVPFKPYVRELHTPSGVQVLRDSPHDHKHHHALMYAIGVDGVSYWEETERAGRQLHDAFSELKSARRGETATARIVEALRWVPPGKEDAVLEETREIEVHDPKAFGATVLSWSTRLEAPKSGGEVQLGGSHYYGLGARFLVSMDKDGTFLSSGEKEGEIVRGDERLTPARWCAYQAKADGKPVTVALFDFPANPRPALWFTMGTPFAYLSATVNLWREPLRLAPGKDVRFLYGVAVWDGAAGKETIESVYRRWLATAPR